MWIGLFGNHTGLAGRLSVAGVEVVVHGASPGGAVWTVDRLEGFFEALDHPRLFLLDLPAGAEVDRVIDESYVVMEPGDVVIDATPSYWGDTLRRFRRMRHRSIFYVDAALLPERGAALLAGDQRGTDLAMPLMERLTRPGGAVRAGEATSRPGQSRSATGSGSASFG